MSKLDIVLFGATGYTGKLTAEYLAGHKEKFTWGIAGRSQQKLEQVRDDLVKQFGSGLKTLPIIVANSDDANSLRDAVSRAKVVMSAIGPFWKHGKLLVEQCAKLGAHYVDITGETPFVRETIDEFEEDAKKSGAKIVSCCGLDCIPSDLGCYLVAKKMQAIHNCSCSSVKVLIKVKGQVKPSGGTMASIINLCDRPFGEAVRVLKNLGDPKYLCPPQFKSAKPLTYNFIGYDSRSGLITSPWLMSAVNSQIVYRSYSLMRDDYGPDLRYGEAQAFPRTLKGAIAALITTIVFYFAFLLILLPPTRFLLRKLVPSQGSGPDREEAKSQGLTMKFEATGNSETAPLLHAEFIINKDAGYGGTAVMFAEAALTLLLDDARLPKGGGFFTPAVAMGDCLIERLNAAGFVVGIEK